jgi:small multidrug resistance pump
MRGDAGESAVLLAGVPPRHGAPWYWAVLLVAILCEVFGTICMKLSAGLERPGPVVGVIVGYACSFTLFAVALKGIDLGVAYAAWSSLGIILTSTFGYVALDESVSAAKAGCLLAILLCVITLNLVDNSAGNA